jgi:hypothetical protein
MRPTPIWIAEMRVVIVHPDGLRAPGHIAIGQPYALGGADPAANFESHCPVKIDGLGSGVHHVSGGGTLSALLLGIQLLGYLLHDFRARGGRVVDADDGTDVDLDSMFGPFLREIPPVTSEGAD